MSREALSWCESQTAGRHKATLLLLCVKADEHGVLWHSERSLAEMLECSHSTMSAHLAGLRRMGLITKARRVRKGVGLTSSVIVLAPTGDRGEMLEPTNHPEHGKLIGRALSENRVPEIRVAPRTGLSSEEPVPRNRVGRYPEDGTTGTRDPGTNQQRGNSRANSSISENAGGGVRGGGTAARHNSAQAAATAQAGAQPRDLTSGDQGEDRPELIEQIRAYVSDHPRVDFMRASRAVQAQKAVAA